MGLRIIFMGTPEFAVPSLSKILHSRHKIVGIVTQPDRPRGRGRKLSPTPVKQFALENNLQPIFQPENLKDPEFIGNLKALPADVFVVVAFRILPEAVYTIPPKGTVNLHPSLLPKYRGAAPIPWTIINGEKVTGVTTIFIQKEIDAGNILLQKEEPVYEEDTAGSLHDRLAAMGAEVLLETLNLLEENAVTPRLQDESQASRAPKITREMTHLSFEQPARKVKNWIHGLSPHPGAYAIYRRKLIKFYRAHLVSEQASSHPPGTILKARGSDLWIACDPGVVAIDELQMQGKKVLGTEEFLRGVPLSEGEKFV